MYKERFEVADKSMSDSKPWAKLLLIVVPDASKLGVLGQGIIPDASRRPPPTPQCISFVWGLSRVICQKVDVVWFEKLQRLW